MRVKLVLRVFAVDAALTSSTKVKDSKRVRNITRNIRDLGSRFHIRFMIFSINMS
jgi:hypothetical protein